MLRTIITTVILPIIAGVVANAFPIGALSFKKRMLLAAILLLVLSIGPVITQQQVADTPPTPTTADALIPETGEKPSDTGLLGEIWDLRRPMLLRYTPFRFTRWMYDDSTFTKWYGLGFLLYAIRFVLCIPALVADLLVLAILGPPALLEATIGETARNFHFGLIVLLLVTEMVRLGRPVGPLSALTAALVVSSFTLQLALLAIPGRIASAIFGMSWWIVIPGTIVLAFLWHTNAKRYHDRRIRERWVTGKLRPPSWWANIWVYGPGIWPMLVWSVHQVAVIFETNDEEAMVKLFDIVTDANDDNARNDKTTSEGKEHRDTIKQP